MLSFYMRPSRTFLIFLLSIVGGIPGPVAASPSQTLQAGEYLETGYIDTLRKTKSPLLAARQDGEFGVPQLATVEPCVGGLQLHLAFNWHEGADLLIINADGSLTMSPDWGDADGTHFNVADERHFSVNAPGSSVRSYEFVGGAERFIAQQVLVGKYRDSAGQAYEFMADGSAKFSERTFKYTIILEQVMDAYDFFRVGDDPSYIAFRWEGSELVLFPVHDYDGPGYGEPDFAHPIVRLNPTKE